MDKNFAFRTVIIERSSVLEAELRRHSQLVRIVDSLPGKAMVIFPSSDSTVAIRLFDLDRWQKKIESDDLFQNLQNTETNQIRCSNIDSQALSITDYDDLCLFRNSFKYPVIFFVSNQSQQDLCTKYLDNPHSLLHRVQDALVCYKGSKENVQGSAKIFIVPNISSILPIVHSILESLKSEKMALKKAYFETEKRKLFYPENDGFPLVNAPTASCHAANALRLCLASLGISHGDANVIMSMFKCIGGLVSADDYAWDQIPIGSREKKIIRTFFGNENENVESNPSLDPTLDDLRMASPHQSFLGNGIHVRGSSHYEETIGHRAACYNSPAIASSSFHLPSLNYDQFTVVNHDYETMSRRPEYFNNNVFATHEISLPQFHYSQVAQHQSFDPFYLSGAFLGS